MLQLYDDVVACIGEWMHLGRKASPAECRATLQRKGARSLANTVGDLQRGRRFLAHPTHNVLQQVKQALASSDVVSELQSRSTALSGSSCAWCGVWQPLVETQAEFIDVGDVVHAIPSEVGHTVDPLRKCRHSDQDHDPWRGKVLGGNTLGVTTLSTTEAWCMWKPTLAKSFDSSLRFPTGAVDEAVKNCMDVAHASEEELHVQATSAPWPAVAEAEAQIEGSDKLARILEILEKMKSDNTG